MKTANQKSDLTHMGQGANKKSDLTWVVSQVGNSLLSHDVTKIQTIKLLILLIFYFNDV